MRNVLIVEDEHALAAALATAVVRAGAEPVKAASGERALEELRGREFALVILDIGLPDMSGLEVLRKAFPKADSADEAPPVPVLVITAHGNLDNAIAARQLGAADYLVKPLDLAAFQETLARLLKRPRARRADPAAGADSGPPLAAQGEDTETTLIGGAPAMQPVFREIAHACSVSMPVVISGATGTGKSLAARVIHANSPGAGGLVRFEGGAETPPVGSTLLVEEVDRLPPAAQERLLALLDGEGGPRVLATCRVPLHDAVTAGTLREDLYYRLNVLEVRLPALAERPSDIAPLAQYFLGRAASERVLVFAPETVGQLERHRWPGNVLELRNAVEYAVAVCGGAHVLPQHLPASVAVERLPDPGELVGALRQWLDGEFAERGDDLRYAELIGGLEGRLLEELLRRFDGKPTRLAAALKMNRTTLRKKCADLLERDR